VVDHRANPGGNSKDRRQHERGNLPEAGAVPAVASSTGGKKQLNLSDTLAVLSIVLGVFCVIIIPPLYFRITAFLFVCGGVFWRAHRSHWTATWDAPSKNIAGVVIVGLCCLVVMPQFKTQWINEHAILLDMDAALTNVGYADGTEVVAGVKWAKGMTDIRLVVGNKSPFPVENIDLGIQVPNPTKELLMGLGQVSAIAGCEFHPPKWPDINLALPIIGENGQKAIINPRDSPAPLSFGHEYKLFCPRLTSGDDLRLIVLAATSGGDIVPTCLRIVGSYQVIQSDGARRVDVDRLVIVKVFR
jgi:hypothetical protein